MHPTTAKLLDYYKEHLNELLADGRITKSEAATAEYYAECAATGADPFGGAVVEEAEGVLRDASRRDRQ